MKTIHLSLALLIVSFYSINAEANCPANSAPSAITSTSVCKTGYSNFSATLNDLTNTLVWLDSANRILGQGNNYQQYIAKTGLSFKAAEMGYDGITTKVGPLASAFSSTYPSQNFTNGQYFTCLSALRIDSISLRSNNPISGNIQIWSKAPENGGYVIRKVPFNITSSGPKNTRVGMGVLLSTGSYFMNVEVTSGTGILYRAIDGATYPYTVSNLISITGTNFIGDLDRYYYFFDWDVSKMCMSPMSAAFSPVVTQPLNNVLPYYAFLNNGIPCDWTNTAPSMNSKWQKGSSLNLTSPAFPIPGNDTNILISNDVTCHCDKSSVLLESPWFDLRDYSKETTIEVRMDYLYNQKNNSKVYIRARNASNTIIKTDSLSNQMGSFGYYTFNLREFILSDSVQLSIEHRDNGGDSSAIAISNLGIHEMCSTGVDLTFEAKFDTYASEISWEIRDAQTNELIVNSIPYDDINPYDSTLAKINKRFCLTRYKQYKFKIKDSFGDGLDDGTNIGNYKLSFGCFVMLQGSGALPYGGLVLPDMAWDSLVFIAGDGPKIDIGPDVVLNFNDTLVIDAGPNWSRYLWSNGDTTRTLTLVGSHYLPGIYSIAIEARLPNLICVARDTIRLEILANFNPILNIAVITDKKGSDIIWELRDKNTDTLLMTRGPFPDVIPYNINLATHIDTITVQHSQLLSFKIIDMSGNGLNDGTVQGRAWISNNCTPEIFLSDSAVFPYSGAFHKYDSLVFFSSARPNFNLGNDIELCAGDSVQLYANSSANEFHWSTGESTPSIWVKAEDLSLGENTITVFNNQGVCHDVDTIKITKRLKASALFSTSQTGGKLTAIGTASGQQAYHWDFGDGGSANTRAAVHQYNADGNYTVTYSITAINGCLNTSTKNISITGVGINELKASQIKIVPNPSAGLYTIEALNHPIEKIDVYDLSGRKMCSFNYVEQTDIVKMNLEFLESGIYFIKIYSNHSELTRKIILNK
ncbi:MAG: T9SS type A sorting domain-containing protein [Sphingobacteriales bacterium]|nr:T9SS type A sorting domain-containing protein [Sphingobacteriales bacterium]